MLAGALGLCACEQIIGADFDKAAFDPGGSSGEGAGPTGGSDGEPCTPGDQESCYEGPEGSGDVGACAAGVRTCGEGAVWGRCEGQVLPAVEDASTPGDENCDRMTGECRWATTLGGASFHSIAVNASGETFVAGMFESVVAAESRIPSSSFQIMKMAPDGAVSWSKGFTQVAFSNHIVAASSDGGVIIGGAIPSMGPDFAGCSLGTDASGASDLVAHLDASGHCTWVRPLGAAASDHLVHAIAAGDLDKVAVAGECSATLTIGGLEAPCSGGQQDGFVAMLDATTGEVEWIRSFGGWGTDRIRGLAMDADGDVFATAEIQGEVDFDGALLGTGGWRTAALVKLDRVEGDVRWARGLGYFDSSGSVEPAIDAQGSIVVVTPLASSFYLGEGCDVTGVDSVDVAVVKFDTNGGCRWARNFAALGEQAPTSVAIDHEGGIIVGGHYKAPVNFGFGLHPLRGNRDAFLLKLGPGGEPLWSRSFGDEEDTDSDHASDTVTGVGVDAAGHIHASGRFDGAVGFCDDGGALGETGMRYTFLASYAP